MRYLDLVAVKGKTQAVPVYELLGRTDDVALCSKYAHTLDLYQQAMVLYEAQQFDSAADLFVAASIVDRSDGVDAPSALYVDRCRELASEPPRNGWDRVYVMKHK